MAFVSVTPSWASVTLTTDEIWQCRGGTVLLTVEAPSGDADDRGIALAEGMVRVFRSGQVVRHRTLQAPGTEAPARLYREVYL